MKYEMEEFVPIVAKLAEQYTSKESTSITYEAAGQLMEAVQYCIREATAEDGFVFEDATMHMNLPEQNKTPSAALMYEKGLECVKNKAKKALDLYNAMLPGFSYYENICLKDTIVKGMSQFFLWYDVKFNPQNTILTLDYPILVDLSDFCGIDKIYNYLKCIELEQIFLNKNPYQYVMEILEKYNKGYRQMIDNICEIVLTDMLLRVIKQKELVQRQALSDLREMLMDATEHLVQLQYDGNASLEMYLCRATDNIAVRLKHASDNGLSDMFTQIV
ncbi:MAG: DUF6179 domain-containing protein [Lachnospiraceae bacterium]|nr:DUF6179 domain-containing protein [Lachnospiraceae bacterium]